MNKQQELNNLRKRIDLLDHAIIISLSQRNKLVDKITAVKKQLKLNPLDPKRWLEIMQKQLAAARTEGLDSKMIKEIYQAIHKFSLKKQNEILKSHLLKTESATRKKVK